MSVTAIRGEPGAAEPPAHTLTRQVVVGGIPAQRSGFQPRPGLLKRLNWASQGPPVVVVLAGPPGAGKTQLAAAYARARLAGGWRLIAWVDARASETLLAGLAAVAEAAALSDGGSRPDAVQALVRWLEADGSRCLLVFDGAEDLDLLRPFLPAAGSARVLITQDQAPAAELGASVPVDAFTTEEALALLSGRTGLTDRAGAAAVAAELGYLPLGLDQAATVITGQHLGYAAYLAKLKALPAKDDLASAEDQPRARAVAGAVLLSLEAARAADPLGVCPGVMEFMAVLSPGAVRRGVLHAAGQTGALLGGGRRVAAFMVDQALERLNRRSLLDVSLDGQTVSAHGLVARVIREGLDRRGRLATVWRAAAAALQPSAEMPGQVTALLDNAEPDHPDTMSTLISLAEAYHTAGRIADAIPVVRQVLAARERQLGPDHPSTLASRNNLATAYRATGRAAEAISLFEQNLAACERLLGADHPKTVASRHHLDLARQDLVDQVGGEFQDDGA